MAKKSHELIYGIHAVEAALRNQQENVLQVFVQQGRNDNRIKKLLSIAENSGIHVQAISNEKLKEKCPKARHQGVVAELRLSDTNALSLDDILDKEQLLLLVLDEVQDPNNIGACLRTAEAAGVDLVVICKDRSAGITPVVRRAASGAAETLSVIQATNLARVLRTLKKRGIWLAGTSDTANESLYATDLTGPLALVMGSEGSGLRHLTSELCDYLISIPVAGQVESLNVSVATGVCLYEINRQRKIG